MQRLPRVSGASVVRALERLGAKVEDIKGSHYGMRIKDKGGQFRKFTVPVHSGNIVKPGTLRNILAQAEVSVEEFLSALG